MMTTRRNGKSGGRKLKPSIGSELIRRMTALRNSIEADDKPLWAKFTVRTVSMPAAPEPYSPDDVQRVRSSLQVSQAVFAALLGVSPKLVRAWEQGGREPNVMARRMLDDIRESPTRWIDRFGLQRPVRDSAVLGAAQFRGKSRHRVG